MNKFKKMMIKKFIQAQAILRNRTLAISGNDRGDNVNTSNLGWIISSVVLGLAIAVFLFSLFGDKIAPGVTEKVDALFNMK